MRGYLSCVNTILGGKRRTTFLCCQDLCYFNTETIPVLLVSLFNKQNKELIERSKCEENINRH